MMSSNLSIMSANLATVASALESMNSTLASMALTDPDSTAPAPAQSEASKPTSIKMVHVLIYSEDTLYSQDSKDSSKKTLFTIDDILGIYLSREMGKDAARRLLTKEVDKRLDDFFLTDDERHRLREKWCVPETEDSRIWETGWIDRGDSPGESSATGENQKYAHLRLVREFVEDASDEVSRDNGKSKDEDKDERGSNRSVGDEY